MSIKKTFEKWANKTFTHVRDDEGDFGIRMVLHFPLGLFMGLTSPFSHDLKDIVKEYENNEDVNCHDEAWKDYYGIMAGIIVGRVIQFTILGITIWWLVRWLG